MGPSYGKLPLLSLGILMGIVWVRGPINGGSQKIPLNLEIYQHHLQTHQQGLRAVATAASTGVLAETKKRRVRLVTGIG